MLRATANLQGWVVLVFVVVQGCAASTLMKSDGYKMLSQSQNLIAAGYTPGPLYFVDPIYVPHGGASGIQGYFEGTHSFEHGAQMQMKYHLIDPAETAKGQFLSLVTAIMTLPKVQTLPRAIENERDLPDPSHLVLDFWTMSWRFAIQRVPHREPEDQQYHFVLKIRARLVQYDHESWFNRSTVFWQQTCKVYPEDLGMQWPTYKELQMNEGALIKYILQKAGEHCAHELTKNFVPKPMP